MFSPRSVSQERDFQRKTTESRWARYMATDILEKVARDEGYRAKLSAIETALTSSHTQGGWVLDIGSGTCGEDEYLSTRGLKIICTDINEVGLAVSKQRCEKFGRPLLSYIACSADALPLADETISAVVFNESLHHMPDASRVLAEVQRVLMPGGIVCMMEPDPYDPWRRLSEVRDYFKGTIEKSFSVGQLRKLCSGAGLAVKSVERPVHLSTEALASLSPLHRLARSTYYGLRRAMPAWLGMIFLVAEKPGTSEPRRVEFEQLLRAPSSEDRLTRSGDAYVTQDGLGSYPIVAGIPVLIGKPAREAT